MKLSPSATPRQGTGELALDAAKSLVLNALTFGGYGTWQLGKAIWAGYHEKDGGFIGALNAVNPLSHASSSSLLSWNASTRQPSRRTMKQSGCLKRRWAVW
jgi:hypothetical protein